MTDDSLVIELDYADVARLADTLSTALKHHYRVTVWVDPLDQAFKIKLENLAWSPPMGTVLQ